jgi:EAL domain-containing protein (putative c-di-GMP-specific phosphodiesterase class I)
MYVAKSRGKRRYELFLPTMHTGVVERLELKADLQRGLDHGHFVLHYQPIVDLASGHVRGVEALVRWRHPERGLVHPAEFIPLAEETGLIRPMGHWVMHEACAQASSWVNGFTLSINLSARQLQEPELVEQVAAALRANGMDPHRLVIEITESVLAQDTEATIARLQALKDLGVGLAIDDFGTGYSSLGYLKRFPLDMVKIAKPFVDDVDGSEEDAVLAGAIVGLGATFRLRIVAEGIERLGQLRRLRALGCGEGQGYLFSRPMDADRIAALLADGDALGPG